ncbi:hypothetical protein ACIBF7_21455 [Nonomuraea sp. NPDC050478]
MAKPSVWASLTQAPTAYVLEVSTTDADVSAWPVEPSPRIAVPT